MNGVSVGLGEQALRPGLKPQWNATVGGQPAIVERPVYGPSYYSAVTCPVGVHREFRSVYFKVPAQRGLFTVSAVLCGPDLDAGNAAVDRLLADISFK
jgi:hypothetical protein